MGKIVFWIVVVFAVLFALRLWNSAKARRRDDGGRPDPEAPQAMVKCVRCGVFLPRADALPAPGGYRCTDPKCAQAPH